MAYIHNQRDPKIEESLLKGCDCTKQKMKEVLMKYGYNCEDIDEQSVKKKSYPILEEVEKILGGDRKESYGEANTSFKRIADYWNAYLCHKRDLVDQSAREEDLPYEFLRGAYLTNRDVAMLMILFKIAREENKHKHDNLADIIGYAVLADKMEE